MKWVVDKIGKTQVWYSGDVIRKIESMILKNIPQDICNNCDGCGYKNGCGDKHCAVYQANKIIELIQKEDAISASESEMNK